MTFVQAKTSADPTVASTTVSVTITAGGAGNHIMGMVAVQNTGITLNSVKDNNGVTYTIQDNASDAPNGTEGWSFYKENISGAPTSIIATFSTSVLARIQIVEWSGLQSSSSLDGHSANPITAVGTVYTLTSITTTADGDLIYAAATTDSTGGTTMTAGSGFTLRNAGTGTQNAYDETQVQATHGAIAPTLNVNVSGSKCLGFVLAFKAAVATPKWIPNADPQHSVAVSSHVQAAAVAIAAASGLVWAPHPIPVTPNTKVAGWYQPLGVAPPVAQAQLGSSFVPFNTPQITAGTPQGWESIASAAPAVAQVNAPQLPFIVPPFAVPSGWQSTSALAPPVALPQFGYSFVPLNTVQTNTATIDKWQQPLSIPVLAPPVQLGASFVPFNTFQINTAPLGWYQALATTPPTSPAQQGAAVLSYNIAPTINTIVGTGWFQALAVTPPAPLSQTGAAFVPFNTTQIVAATFTLAWQQPLASTPAPALAQSGSISLSYNIQPLLNTVVGMPWQQPLSTAVPVAIAYQGQSFVPYNTAQTIVVTTIQHSNPFMATVGAMTCIN